MRGPNGENPMSHDCEKHGCWRKHFCPSVDKFAKAFPGLIALTDVDYMAERNECFVFVDYKQDGKDIPTGQWLAFTALTKLSPRVVAWVIWHAPGKPDSYLRIRVIRNGVGSYDEPTNFADIFHRLEEWVVWAESQPKQDEPERVLELMRTCGMPLSDARYVYRHLDKRGGVS